MDLLSSTILAVVQGVTEFLPISSSGHLSIAQHLLNIPPTLTLDIVLNTATLFSVLFFFKKQTSYFFQNLKYIIIGTIPTVVVGLIFKNQIEHLFSSSNYLSLQFLATSLLLISTKFTAKTEKYHQITPPKAFIIGLFQSLAIIPAISRSGATISAALFMGISPLEAFNFSFALFIPASIGALILDAKNISLLLDSPNQTMILISFLLTFIVGVFALKTLRKFLTQGTLWYFAIYTTILALTLLAFPGALI